MRHVETRIIRAAPFGVFVKVNLSCFGGRAWFCWHSQLTDGFMSVRSTKIMLTLWGEPLYFLNTPLNTTLLRLHEIALIPGANVHISLSVSSDTGGGLQCFFTIEVFFNCILLSPGS